MAYAKGSIVQAGDYNAGADLTRKILGVGDRDYGYGQTTSTSNLVAGELITARQWTNLYKDLNRIKDQQTGVSETATPPNVGDIISYDVKFDNAINEIEANRFVLGGASTVSQQVESKSSAPWSGTIVHEFNASYPADSYNRLRYFFNTGSHIKMIPSFESLSGVDTSPGTAEFDMLKLIRSVGDIRFNYTKTDSTNIPSTGPGGTDIGFYDLSTAYQRIFYATNAGYTAAIISLEILAKSANAGDRIDFRLVFTAEDAGPDGEIDAAIISAVGYQISQLIQLSYGAPTITTTQNFP